MNYFILKVLCYLNVLISTPITTQKKLPKQFNVLSIRAGKSSKIMPLFRVVKLPTTHLSLMGLTRESFITDGHDDDVIKWKHFQRYWSFVRGIHRSPVNSPHKSQ